MYPLLLGSLAAWVVIFERVWRLRRLSRDLKEFHHESLKRLLQRDRSGTVALCRKNPGVPTAILVETAIERLGAADARLRDRWLEAVERERQRVNHELRSGLWILGTVATSAPFVGLFGTVVGILQSFGDIAATGKGGFAVVASGISEALVATATGIVVAVVAAVAFNIFQTRVASLILVVRTQTEELLELLAGEASVGH